MMNNTFKSLNRGIGTTRDLSDYYISIRRSISDKKAELNDSAGHINEKISV